MYQRYVALRDQKGFTDYQVAQKTGIAKSVFSEWKSGRSSPKMDKLYLIAQLFEVPLEYFVEKEDE